jgi:hypothetical protein
MTIKSARRKWLRLYKLAAVCKKCGYDNPYVDSDPNYVCRQCKKREEIWGGEDKSDSPKPATPVSAPVSPAFDPYTFMRDLQGEFDKLGAKSKWNVSHTEYSYTPGEISHHILLDFHDDVKQYRQNFDKIINIIEGRLGKPDARYGSSPSFPNGSRVSWGYDPTVLSNSVRYNAKMPHCHLLAKADNGNMHLGFNSNHYPLPSNCHRNTQNCPNH